LKILATVVLHLLDNRKKFKDKYKMNRWCLLLGALFCLTTGSGFREVVHADELGFKQYRENVLKQIAEYKAALKKDPSDAQGHFRLGVSYQALGRHEEEIGEYLEAIRLEPDFAEAHFNLAQAYDLTEDGVHSIRHMLRARQIYSARRNHRGIRTSQRQLRGLYEKYGTEDSIDLRD
jgi:tetratricopeptide (TPR) repeat protein